MAPRPELILQNVLRNASEGTFGLVAILNGSTTSTMLPLSLDNDTDYDLSGNETVFDEDILADCGGHNMTTLRPRVTNLGDIPAKEIIIVILMLGLWVYSIVLTRKAWLKI